MKKSFKVFAPKWSYKLAIAGFLIFVLIPGLIGLIDDCSPVVIIVSAVLFSPFLVAALWGYRFRVIVREDTITVRQGIGKEYIFNVNEITKVVRRVNINSYIGTLVKITIYTKSRHVSVETLMTGCDKMESYIAENVAHRKYPRFLMAGFVSVRLPEPGRCMNGNDRSICRENESDDVFDRRGQKKCG